jgi:hypothetical protein
MSCANSIEEISLSSCGEGCKECPLMDMIKKLIDRLPPARVEPAVFPDPLDSDRVYPQPGYEPPYEPQIYPYPQQPEWWVRPQGF